MKDILEVEVPERYYLKESVVEKLLIHRERNVEKGNNFGAKFHDRDGKMNALRVKGKEMYDLVKEERAVVIPNTKNRGG